MGMVGITDVIGFYQAFEKLKVWNPTHGEVDHL
jgi:hypothetical protein